jgi:hypothetical protein
MVIIEHRVAGSASPPLRTVTIIAHFDAVLIEMNSHLSLSQDNRHTALEAAAHLYCLTKSIKVASQHI